MTLTDAVASKQAAWAMCATFGISVTSPKQQVALPTASRHNSGNAVDLKLTHYVGKTMKNADGEDVVINSFPEDGTGWADLWRQILHRGEYALVGHGPLTLNRIAHE